MTNTLQVRLLLVDNSAAYRHSVRGFLELEGYSIIEAGTVEEAMEKLELDNFDLVLTGLRLEDDSDFDDMSGLQVAKAAANSELPCIIVTAFPTVELARMALRSKKGNPLAVDLVLKSSGPQALLDSIQLALRNVRASESARGLSVDLEKGLVSKDGKQVDLTRNQYILLAELYKKGGGISTAAALMKAIYDEQVAERIAQRDPRLLNLVSRVKERIERKGFRQILEEVPGEGYRLNPIFVPGLAAPTPDVVADVSTADPNIKSESYAILQSTPEAGKSSIALLETEKPEADASPSQQVRNSIDRTQSESAKFKRPLNVFLCHSSGDKLAVRKLYNKLSKEIWIDPWLDEKKILPGDDWDFEIRQAVKTADIVLVCLSQSSVTKEGYVQKEIRQALDMADEKPDGTTYVIPMKLEPCDVPPRLQKWQWLDYYEDGAYKKLLLSLRRRALLLHITND
jgi:DNA-binding response OmpR family regulator